MLHRVEVPLRAFVHRSIACLQVLMAACRLEWESM